MKKFYSLALCCLVTVAGWAQNPAGNAFRSDYDAFQIDNLRRYFNCGNANMLNPGDELTVEVWLQFRDLGDNQKIIGKFGLNNSGFLLGVDQGRIYPEVWNPVHYDPIDGLMSPTALHWQHLAFSFTRGDSLRTYINGKQVGSHAVGPNPISTNTDPLIIGVASWDLSSFQSFGNLDEVRIWNVARTSTEIRGAMFTELSGNESGLLAYYDFNQSTGNTLPDVSGNGNDGTGVNVDASEWVPSRAVIANAATASKNDLQGLWNGLSFMDPRVASTNNGMTMVGSGMDTADYVVFGHDGGNGTSTADLESNVPNGFERTSRIWTTTEVGSVQANILMKLSDAAGSGTMLDDSKPAVNYTLLFRSGTSGEFKLAGKGASKNNDVITFTNVFLQQGEYVIGVGDAEYEGVVGIENMEVLESVKVFPNPSNGLVSLNAQQAFHQSALLEIIDLEGRTILRQTWNGAALELDLTAQAAGVYVLRLSTEQGTHQKRLVIR
ncbi:MAG: LamG-like jellyroll fold domain-containing protein [Salibacteraceae bacterium]